MDEEQHAIPYVYADPECKGRGKRLAEGWENEWSGKDDFRVWGRRLARPDGASDTTRFNLFDYESDFGLLVYLKDAKLALCYRMTVAEPRWVWDKPSYSP